MEGDDATSAAEAGRNAPKTLSLRKLDTTSLFNTTRLSLSQYSCVISSSSRCGQHQSPSYELQISRLVTRQKALSVAVEAQASRYKVSCSTTRSSGSVDSFPLCCEYSLGYTFEFNHGFALGRAHSAFQIASKSNGVNEVALRWRFFKIRFRLQHTDDAEW
jgi:hypothetical protein